MSQTQASDSLGAFLKDKLGDHRGDRRANTYSQYDNTGKFYIDGDSPTPFRRGSHDEPSGNQRRFLVHVDSTLESLTAQEDTDGNTQITIEDNGPKVLRLRTSGWSAYNSFDVRGTYPLSNLLQELTLAKEFGKTRVWLDESQLFENPVKRLSRLISDHFWDGLTRRIDATSIARAAPDPKDWTPDARSRIYIPAGAPEQYEYFLKVAVDQPGLNLDVQMLPAEITPATARDLNDKPGLLTVAMEEVTVVKDGKEETTLQGKPFGVPGGRFNELYGWDCYFMSLGLLINGKVDLVKSMVENFAFCIEHYGMILIATRSYYLGRAHPPFFTDLILRVYEHIKHRPGAKDFLLQSMRAAIKEYHTVWTSEPRLDPATGLSRYRSVGIGVPPETEPTHFVHILKPYLEKHGMTYKEFVEAYNYGKVVEPELDEYFVHDRALRESGHDSSYRVEGICGDLATVDLNSLLFKYETDIGMVIRKYFDEKLVMTEEFCAGTPYAAGEVLSSAPWDRRAKRRRMMMNKLMWDSSQGMFFDYNTKTHKRTSFESSTTLWTLWAGVATPDQASELVEHALPKLEAVGGLLTTTEKSRGPISADRPQRQWDYPFGWAPQQILAWTGLLKYGFTEDAQRLAYKWLFMMTKAFVDFNGVVTEKYDVTRTIDPHRADAEYGNQGLGFKGVNKEGFGWANASYVYGLQLLDAHMIRALGALTPHSSFEKAVKDG